MSSSSLPTIKPSDKLKQNSKIINPEMNQGIKRRLDYFYTPYGHQNETHEQCMHFDGQDKKKAWKSIKEKILEDNQKII